MRERKTKSHKRMAGKDLALTLLESVLVIFLCFLIYSPDPVFGVIGETNVTQISLLEIGNAPPVITSVLVDNPITLNPNATKTVLCTAIIEKYGGDIELKNASAELFDTSVKNFGDSDDKNDHYTNSSCVLDVGYGDAYTAQANCTFEVEYYANPSGWNCTVQVYDLTNFKDIKSNSTTIETLLALGLPDSINYGLVNATFVSDEATVNVTNYGNVELNLTLSSYAQTEGDNKAMNCSMGSLGYISDFYEKYNLTSTVTGPLTLSEFEGNYTNVTGTPTVRSFNLVSRTNDLLVDEKETYWRIYVPRGVAGTCTGNLIFGATQAPEV